MESPKTIENHFVDWEATAFGYGYGSGEAHVLAALKTFFENLGRNANPDAYDYKQMENALTPTVAWLLINVLCHQDILEYGTSPRYAWLTPEGIHLRKFVASKSADELLDLVCSVTEDHNICYPNACNCGPNGYEKGRVCPNPFWRKVA